MMVTIRTIARPTLTQFIVAVGGMLYLFSGIAQIAAPEWFYREIGTFPPYNRHYIGDLGSFLIPLGIGLLIAARSPARHMLTIGVAALGSLLHSLNHLYDTLTSHATLEHWINDTIPLFVLGALMMIVIMQARQAQNQQ